MNLDALWQANRRFLIRVLIAVVIFLIVRAVLGSTVKDRLRKAERQITVTKRKIAAPHVDNAALASARSLLEQLQARTTSYADRSLPPLAGEFRPDPGEAPSRHYIEFTGRRRQELVRMALLRNIEIDESLGLPPVSPTQPEVIRRVLRGFVVVDQVVREAVAVGAIAIEDLSIATRATQRRLRGVAPSPLDATPVAMDVLLRPEALDPFLGTLFRHEPPLGLTACQVLPEDKKGHRRLHLEFGAAELPDLAAAEEAPQ